MTDILSGFHISDMLNNTTTFIAVFAPIAEILIGILLAFFIIDILVSSLRGIAKTNPDYVNDDDTEEEW